MLGMLFAEDLQTGRRFELGAHRVSAQEIKAFARDWDPLPFHVDEQAAEASPFGGLVASGAHSLAICVRLMSDAVVSRSAVVAGRGIKEARFLRPVRPGMLLTGTATIADCRMLDDGRGMVVLRGELHDEDGELVTVLVGEMLVRRDGAEL
jgi:acyl dehydratase